MVREVREGEGGVELQSPIPAVRCRHCSDSSSPTPNSPARPYAEHALRESEQS